MPNLPHISPLLDALLLEVSNEVYILDTSSMQLVYVSDSALKDTGYDRDSVKQHSVESLLGLSQQALQDCVVNHSPFFLDLPQDQAPLIGNIKSRQLRMMVMQSGRQEFALMIKSDSSRNDEATQALSDSELRFQAIVSNTPGLVFQFQLNKDGEINFVYLSDGCKALLGLSVEDLKQDPKIFYALMNARDRGLLRQRLELSAIELSLLDWEGRVWIDGWQDTKWINLRAFPRILNDDSIQWEGIMINITQSKNEKNEIEQTRRELAELTAHMESIKEQERCRIAREIHDNLGGNLTAIKIGLSSIINRLKLGQNVSVMQAQGLESIVDNTFEEIHRISTDLRPNVLDLGIVAALEWQSEEFARHLAIACQFTSNQADVAVTDAQAIALFRICQESMSNIAKHAKATNVYVDLITSDHEIVMTIRDNGVGIEVGNKLKANSFGLRGMQERVTTLYGNFSIARLSEPDKQGTIVTIRLPK
ncbi:MAG: histidine kinase [Betaproteobacteria bacterium]